MGCVAGEDGTESSSAQPNIVFILADDLGYSDIGAYGSEIDTPNLDRLAEHGIRFSQAYNHAVCYPTRAAFLTGAYPQQVDMMEGPENITGAFTVGDMLKKAGYRTLWAGKHHGTQSPLDMGFDRYYGLRDGCSNYFNPGDRRPGEEKPARKESMYPRKWIIEGELCAPFTPEDSDFYVTTAITDRVVQWLEEYRKEEKPFFLYLAHQAPHDPLQAWPEDIEKYLGTYMEGYAATRRARFEKQKKTGLLGDRYELSEATHRDWRSLSETEKLVEDSTMAVYAAMIDRLDREIGRVLDKIKAMGEEENTLILFASDNGGAHQVVTMKDSGPIGSISRWTSLGPDWANVANTPLRKSKVYSHEGGIRTPLIAYWPAGIEDGGRVVRTPVHVIDFLPTFAELAGIKIPESYEEAGADPKVYNNEPLVPVQGVSITPLLKGNELERGEPLFQQLRRGKALRADNWKIVSWRAENEDKGDWELYNMREDPTETNDLSKERPEVLGDLVEKYERWMEEVSK
ncbi:arylsulfatase [Fodinibius sediminis]|uniref:Arylsulfatase n=2 Tax=Fodinibius sediminis TaxID=1214077 RepID=A0A521EAM7_9BACT|nr:arylsulfatase [Fodinibius sediminis]